MANSSRRNGGSRSRERFAGIPHAVMKTEKYRSLNGWAVRMLLDLTLQYNGPGTNNGDLSLPYTKARDLGWRSPGTLARAERDLREAGFIIRTRVGGYDKGCNLYAVTWQPIDPCVDRKTGKRKHLMEETRTPPGTWKDGVEAWDKPEKPKEQAA